MLHKSAMGNKDLICCGHKVADHHMTDADRAWAQGSKVIQQDSRGCWFHTLITDRDRATRAAYWKPDTGPHRA